MQKIVPHIWFRTDPEEALDVYEDALPGCTRQNVSRYPLDGLPEFQQPMAGQILTAEIDLAGLRVAMINGGGDITPSPAISFILNFDPSRFDDARDALTSTWEKLSVGGRTLMPLDAYPFSVLYGWVIDRFGVSWQLMLTDPEGEERPFAAPSLMFCGEAQNRAAEAGRYYRGIFPDSSEGAFHTYMEKTGPAGAGAVMYSDFTLAGQWFSAMDSGVEQPFTFNQGISFAVLCEDQEEIDHYWEALSDRPEAEVCGWCVDRFGVSWQVTPENMGDFMRYPGSYERMMQMKKLDIAYFKGETDAPAGGGRLPAGGDAA